jgi:hypothetical protein
MPAVRAALVSQPPSISIAPEPPASSPSVAPGSQPSLRPAATTKSRGALLLAAAASALGLVVIGFFAGQRYGERRAVLAPGGAAVAPVFEDTIDVTHFQRGNVHSHTTRSDGHQPPEEVAAWYRDHGYQFLVISEHDKLVDPAELSSIETAGFVLVAGEEISSSAAGKPVHVQALCIDHAIDSGKFDDAKAALTDGVGAVRAQRGVPMVNHPNFQWALDMSDLASVAGDYALEIWSGNPDANVRGDATHPAAEAAWDELLARGRRVTGYAVDDMHTLAGPEEPGMHGLPGRAWIETFGGETSRAAICDALAKGRLFASSGVRLRRISVAKSTLTIWVDEARAEVEFIGDGGAVLSRVDAGAAKADGDLFAVSYALRGGESYVRARVSVAGTGSAWTQAYRAGR